jgi:sulfate adenylyltransferase large subunit
MSDTGDGALPPLVCATAGSVDDGKSTLLGRLLLDAKALMSDQIEHVTELSKRRGLTRTDLALLTDGLRAEREQGITIDVAWRYFATPKRRFVLADSPGHIQYTRNMVTAASHADVAIILVDVRRAVTEQARRHLFVARLLGVPSITVAINKMDQVGFSFESFASVRDEVARYLDGIDLPRPAPRVTFIPVSALHGDNVVEPSTAMPWHDGTTLLAHLEGLAKAVDSAGVGARLAVQATLRPQSDSHPDFRGYAGRLTSGTLAVGQSVRVLPAGASSTIAAIHAGGEPVASAHAGRSIVACLADDIDVGRGDLIVGEGAVAPRVTTELTADLAWLNAAEATIGAPYLLKCGTREVRAFLDQIETPYDVASGRATSHDGRRLGLNDLARVRMRTGSPIVVDAYRDARATGSFLLVDPTTSETLGAGMVL